MTARTLTFALALALATDSGIAAAQAADAGADDMGSDIVVTAQKRSERLIDVPLSISAVSGDQLVQSGITSTLDLQQVAPGIMTVTNGIGFVPSIRGVQSTGTSPGDEGNVAIYLDDVSLGSPLAGYFDLADIERIEVLKGPQGTLFGRNATGGAIRIITRKPSFTPTGSFTADYGLRYDELRLGGFVSGPVTETVAASLSASYRKGDGFIKGIGPNVGKTYGGSDNYLVRGKILLQPSERFSLLLTADSSSNKNDVAFSTGVDNNANPAPGPGSIANGAYTFAGSTQPKIRVKGWGGSADASWEPVDDITVRSITGYRDVDLDSRADVDRTNQPLTSIAIEQYQKSFSQEFNVSSSKEQALSWIVGSYYYHSKAGNPHFAFALGDTPGGFVVADFRNRVTSEALSGFGEATLRIQEKFFLTGGIRYNSEKKHFTYDDIVTFATPNSIDSRKRWNSTVFRAVGRYEFSDDANVYASYSTGFKSGVYNSYVPLDAPVNPEKIDAFEIGAKARVAGWTLTAAAFAYDYKDLQLSAYTNVNGFVVVTLSNAASAKMRGVEFTADGKIGGGFSLGAGVSYQPTARYGSYPNAQVTLPIPGATGPIVGQVVSPYDVTGSRMVRSPKFTGNLRLSYDADLFGGAFNGTLNAYHNSGFFWQSGNLTREGHYTTLNGRLSWKEPRTGITFSLWGNNLTNAVYSVDRAVQTEGGDSVSLPPKREIGIGAAFSF